MERRLGDRELYVYSIPAWSLDIIINIHDRFLFLTWFSSCRGGTCGTSLSKSTGTQKLWRAYRYSKGSYQIIFFVSVNSLSLLPSRGSSSTFSVPVQSISAVSSIFSFSWPFTPTFSASMLTYISDCVITIAILKDRSLLMRTLHSITDPPLPLIHEW